jgi:hypothetical protein
VSFDLQHFEKIYADVVLSVDPEAAIAALAEQDRALFAAFDRDGLRISSLIVARLRFERLIHGSSKAGDWFERDARAFTQAFKRYHASVVPVATFPGDEARAFEAWLATQ